MEEEVGGVCRSQTVQCKLVRESVFIWRTMENHEKFLRLGAFSVSKKKIIVVYHVETVHL